MIRLGRRKIVAETTLTSRTERQDREDRDKNSQIGKLSNLNCNAQYNAYRGIVL